MGLFDYFKKKEPVPQKDYAEDWQFNSEAAKQMLAPQNHIAENLLTKPEEFKKLEKLPFIWNVELKECTKCYNRKALTDFSFLNKQKGTRNVWCKACFKEYDKERTAKKKLLKLTQVPDHVVLEQMGDKQSIAEVFQQTPKIQQYYEQAESEPDPQQQLQDILDDIDILTARVARLQALLNKNETN